MKGKQIKDLSVDYLSPVSETLSLERAWDYMVKNKVKAVPVIDKADKYIGTVTMERITEAYMHDIGKDLAGLSVPIKNIMHTMQGTSLEDREKEVILKDVKFLNVKEKHKKDEEKGETVILTPYDKNTIERIMIRCIPVKYILKQEDDVTVELDDEVKKLDRKISESEVRYLTVLNREKLPVGVIEREELLYQYKDKKVKDV